MVAIVALEFTPLEFETVVRCDIIGGLPLEFTPLEIETNGNNEFFSCDRN